MAEASGKAAPSAEAVLRSLLARLDAKTRTLARAALKTLRTQLPAADELVYDYGSRVVIAYSPTERGIDAVASIVASDKGVLVRGGGTKARSIALDSAARLADADVLALIAPARASKTAKPSPKTSGQRLVRPTAAARRAAEAPRHRIFAMPFASVYPAYVNKAERKGRTQAEVDDVIRWLTGYTAAGLRRQLEVRATIEAFFAEAPAMHPNRGLITGVVCGVRVEAVDDPLMRMIRQLDKLVDELAKGRPMTKILRG